MELRVAMGDITRAEVDVVVNAANENLAHGGGVAAAVARAGAPEVDAESAAWVREHGPLGPGQAARTGAGAMPARWVVHVVGPRYHTNHDNAALLTQAVEAALDEAVVAGARSIAIPAISAGIFGYPAREAASVIAEAVKEWADRHPDALDEVVFMAYDEAMAAHFTAALEPM